MTASLWGAEFTVPDNDKKIISKSKAAKKEVSIEKIIKSSKVSLDEKLNIISENVNRILGRFKDDTQVIYSKDELVKYIDDAINNGLIAVDTETNNSLDPITCKIMGACIYVPGRKNAYIPINHVNKYTRERLPNQLTEKDLAEQFSRLANTGIIMHNGSFDYQVIKCTCGIPLHIYWDTMIASKILDENEHSHKLKDQYKDKVDPTVEKYSIDHLFKGVEYAVVDPELFALYAATDSFMTYKLYEWQLKEYDKPDNSKLKQLLFDVEFPVVEVSAEMELAGVCIDSDYAKILEDKYNKELIEVQSKIQNEISTYQKEFDKWKVTKDANLKEEYIDKKTGQIKRKKSKLEQIEFPINTGSSIQLAILLYDILKIKPPNKEKPRSCGEEELEHIDLPFCKLILKERGIKKLLNTYVKKIPECINAKTGRLHAHFNQLGADTGRFSSSDPNLQNIPAHELSIRLMFVPSPGNVFVGSDYSQQEPRVLSSFSKDQKMVDAYINGKDLYATMGMGVYHNNYWDNMEHYEDGSPNVEGKNRRKKMKILYLGITYGMGSASIAERLSCSKQEAEEILESFYNSFTGVKKWKDETDTFVQKYGYVEDLWGRRRRLPNILLEPLIIKPKNYESEFNPILGSSGKYIKKDSPIVLQYRQRYEKLRSREEKQKLRVEALTQGIEIIDNSGYINTAKRQAINARIQGSAATMSKKAMISIYKDSIMKELGFKLLIAVHDELIGECPKENAEKVSKRLSELMLNAGKPECTVPMKCDAVITNRWYEDEYLNELQKVYASEVAAGNTKDEAILNIRQQFPESSIFNLDNLLS